MFLDQELKNIQESKNRLAICCELRRSLIHLEVKGIWRGLSRTVSSLTLGLAVAEQIFDLLSDRKKNRN
jgi:hypothetical protein